MSDINTIQKLIDDEIGPKATELAAGVTLYTKDGSTIGNAIIIREVPPSPEMIGYLKTTKQKLWLIETDFGNRCNLVDNEIADMFTLGRQTSYKNWFNDRLEALNKWQ